VTDFSKHPSDIAMAAGKYLAQLEIDDEAKQLTDGILDLFIEALKGNEDAYKENDDGEFVLIANWNDYWGGAIDNFLDYWLQRKFMGPPEFTTEAPRVLRGFVEWSYAEKYFDAEHYEDYLLALPENKTEELERIQKLGDLFYRLHSPNPGAWARGEKDNVKSIDMAKRPEKIEEGYMIVKKIADESAKFRFDRKILGPVMLTKGITELLRVGDVVNLTLGCYGKNWKVLETGNVYPEGTFEG